MYTQCPKCRTIFAIDEAALQAALGIVRCGHCSERFDALRTLSGDLPAGPDATLPDHDPEQLTPVLTQVIAPPDAGTAPVPPETRRAVAPPTETQAAAPAHAPDDAPAQARSDPFAARPGRALIARFTGFPPRVLWGDPAWIATALPVPAPPVAPQVVAFPPVPRLRPIRDTPVGVDITADPAVPAAADGPEAIAQGTDAEADVIATAPPEAPPAAPKSPQLLLLTHEDPGSASTQPIDVADAGAAAASGAGAGVDAASAVAPAPAEPGQAGIVPTYVAPRRPRVRRSSALFALGCVALALLLAAQLGWARRAALVRDPATQAWALDVCAALDCRLPPIRDPAKLELLSRDIRSDPGTAGALLVTATIRNNAPFRQPWPVVTVRLTDFDNDVIAMRRFRPAAYVSDGARLVAGLAPGTTAAVVFEVADPGARASGFRFSFE